MKKLVLIKGLILTVFFAIPFAFGWLGWYLFQIEYYLPSRPFPENRVLSECFDSGLESGLQGLALGVIILFLLECWKKCHSSSIKRLGILAAITIICFLYGGGWILLQPSGRDSIFAICDQRFNSLAEMAGTYLGLFFICGPAAAVVSIIGLAFFVRREMRKAHKEDGESGNQSA